MRRRTWLHPRSFTPLDVIDRVRWQLTGVGVEELSAAVTAVRLTPENVDAAANHEQGLWGGGPDERIHHALSRVQSMLGHEAVLTATVGGGRLVADRRVLAPWGERAAPQRDPERPWPGRLPGFSPASVLGDRPRRRRARPGGRDGRRRRARHAERAARGLRAAGRQPAADHGVGGAVAGRRALVGPGGGAQRAPPAGGRGRRIRVAALLRVRRGWWAEARYD